MEITAQIIEGIKYKPLLKCELVEYLVSDFEINSAKSSSLILQNQDRFAISKWVSPKRTRSYPYERVYNTFSVSKRITIIPIIKDEGASGDRDFLQWDTVCLMSLLDVYVVLAYYETAEKHRTRDEKVTKQRFNSQFVLDKIREVSNYHSSALHWNLKELNNITQILQKVKHSYRAISDKTKVKFHSEKGLDSYVNIVSENLTNFMEASRNRSKSAQEREFLTVQPKEILSTLTKAKLTITNYLGGKYFFTVDEVRIEEEKLFLIESKHSKNSKLPSLGDIKDGLLKMMLYVNLENVNLGKTLYKTFPVLKLTSKNLENEISSNSPKKELEMFLIKNRFNKRQIDLLRNLFLEANENNFVISLGEI